VRTVITILGAIVLLVVCSPAFVWLGMRIFNGYGSYVHWVDALLSGIGGR